MPSATSSFDLIERFRHGDQDAFTRLFEKYRRRLCVLIHYKLGNQLRRSLDVDDVLQEAFFIASRDMSRFTYTGAGSFMSWLARIVDHVLIDAARFENREKRQAEWTRLRSASN